MGYALFGFLFKLFYNKKIQKSTLDKYIIFDKI